MPDDGPETQDESKHLLSRCSLATHEAPRAPVAVTDSFSHPLAIDVVQELETTRTADQSVTASETRSRSISSTSNETLNTTSTPISTTEDNAAVVVASPYRQPHLRHRTPKSILKPAPLPQARFSFRRDVLNYVGESLSPLSAGTPVSLSQSNLSTGTSPPVLPATHATNTNKQNDTSGQNSSTSVLQNTPVEQQIAPGSAGMPSKGGNFWKRLGGAVTAVAAAANVQVPQAAARTINNLGGIGIIPAQTVPEESSAALPLKTPTGSDPNALSTDSVKSVRFTMSSLTVVYPINAPSPPGTEATTRTRVNREYNNRNRERLGKGWTGEELARLYDECCRTREEPGIPSFRKLLISSPQPPKVIDLKNQLLTKGAVEVLSDVLSVDFGLKKLILENCGLDDESLKPLIHALLVSASLPTLSLANNKRIRTKGWKLLAIFVRKAHALRYLDISDNLVDKKIADQLVLAISAKSAQTNQPTSAHGTGLRPQSTVEDDGDPLQKYSAPLLSRNGLTQDAAALSSLRMENCSLKNPTLESLAHGIRQSKLKHISLRRNRINAMGAVALAIMIRDYELPNPGDRADTTVISLLNPTNGINSPTDGTEHHPPSTSTDHESTQPGNATSTFSKPRLHQPGNSVTARLEAASKLNGSHDVVSIPAQLPHFHNPTHRDSSFSGPAGHPPISEGKRSDPAVTAVSASSKGSSTFGISGLSDDVDDDERNIGPDRNRGRIIIAEREAVRHMELKTRLQRQIEALPRVGHLLTLDIRSNDLRSGVTYIAQVLKRNRTLRVLNLSDNKLDSQGLCSISEAMKYNSTLETLDMSNNPCCGQSLEGINALRVALALNSSLMRLFLNNTEFNSAAAISLAEFLPEAHSLIHLDLTDNSELEIAGIMALSAAVKLNTTIRCLDLSIPPNDPEFARLSQDILQSCIRNTELAQQQNHAKGLKASVATPIYKSDLAKNLRQIGEHSVELLNDNEEALASLSDAWKLVIESARQCVITLAEVVDLDEEHRGRGEAVQSDEIIVDIFSQGQAAASQLKEALFQIAPGNARDTVGVLSSHLAVLLQRARTLYNLDSAEVVQTPPKVKGGPRSRDPPSLYLETDGAHYLTPQHTSSSASPQMPSPSFSITDSDDSENDDINASTSQKGADQLSPNLVKKHPASKTSLRLDLPSSPTKSTELTRQSSPKSPVESQSRNLTLEEGEVFRKGTSILAEMGGKTLLDVLDNENEQAAGEELKQEILERPVHRNRRASTSSVTDDVPSPSSPSAMPSFAGVQTP